MNAKDKSGQTVLHHLARKVYCDPDLGRDFKAIISDLSTFENVNAQDNNSVTPYTWILRGKLEAATCNSDDGVFIEIEQNFRKKHADVEKATTGLIRQCFEIIENLQPMQEDRMKKFLSLLEGSGTKIIEGDQNIFTEMIKKAGKLISSTFYIKIIQKMAEAYKMITKKLTRPLDCLVQHIYEESIFPSTRNQGKILSLVKILLPTDDNPRSSESCLRLLIMNAEYTSGRTKNNLQWTEELICILELLLNAQQDPTWVSDGEGKYAQFSFFNGIYLIIDNDKHLANALTKLLSCFLTKSCNRMKPSHNLLHELLNWEFRRRPKDLPVELEPHQIISKVIEDNPDLLHMTDEQERTPLHILAQGVYDHPEAADKLLLLSYKMITHKNVNAKDKDSVTPLSWILLGKARWRKNDSETERAFSDLEEIFLKKGADANLVMKEAAILNINIVETKDELDICGDIVLQHIECCGKETMDKSPRILLEFLKKANGLILSDHFINIVEKMAIIYSSIEYKLQDGALDIMIAFICNLRKHENLLKNQDRLLELCRVILPADRCGPCRSRCLAALIKFSTLIQPGSGDIEWTEDFIKTVKHLLNNQADPMFLPPQGRGIHAQYAFFYYGPEMLISKPDLSDALTELVPLFMAKDSSTYKHGTPLHILVFSFCFYLNKKPPNKELIKSYYTYFKRVIDVDDTLVSVAEPFQETPLNMLQRKVVAPQIIQEIMLLLESDQKD